VLTIYGTDGPHKTIGKEHFKDELLKLNKLRYYGINCSTNNTGKHSCLYCKSEDEIPFLCWLVTLKDRLAFWRYD
jgi:hypothetical protein